MGNIFPNKFPNKLMIGYLLNKMMSKLLPFTEHSIYGIKKNCEYRDIEKSHKSFLSETQGHWMLLSH